MIGIVLRFTYLGLHTQNDSAGYTFPKANI
jgi:hypothetical protein